MFSKIFIICSIAAICNGSYLGHSHGSGVSSQSFTLDSSQKSYDLHDYHSHDHHEHENAYPRYQYKYTVSDDQTRDQKSHQESRDGDNVEGEYSLVQPDGKTRTVTYTADKENGFQAEVRTSGGDDYYHDIHQFNQLHNHVHY